MEEKLFELFEKFYIEFKDFKSEMLGFKSEVNGRFDSIEGRLTKLEINGESIDDKLSEAFEAIEAHAQINEAQHKEIMDELRGELNIVQLAVKRAAK